MAKGLTPKHTACYPGKVVIVKPRVGDPIIDIFVKRKRGVIYLKNYGKITKKEIRSFAVLKKQNYEQDDSRLRHIKK